MVFDAIFYGIALPVIVAALLLLALGRPRRPEGSRFDVHAVALALAAAYVAGHWGVDGPPEVAPLDVVDWMPHLALLGLAWSAAAQGLRERRVARAALDTGVALLASWLLLSPVIDQAESAATAGLTLGLTAALLVVLALVVERAAEDPHPLASGALLTLYAAAVAGVAAASGTLRVAQLVGVVAAALGATTAASLLFARPLRFGVAARAIATLVWGGIVLTQFYAELQTVPLMLLALAPVGAVVLSLGLQQKKPALRFAAEAALVLALVGTAGWRAAVGGMEPAETDAAGEGSTDYGYAY